MQAQEPAFYHLSAAEGLSDNNVSTVARDRNGILWIATSEGLNSFDGNRITTFNKYTHPELPDNNIDRIIVDSENRLWIRTTSHYLVMLDEKRKFHRIPVGDTTDSNPVNYVFVTTSHGVLALKGKQHYQLSENGYLQFKKIKTPFDEALTGAPGFTYFLNNDRAIYYRNKNMTVVDYATMKVLMQIPFAGISGASYINDDELIAFTSSGEVFYRIRISSGKVEKEYRNIKDQNGFPITGILRNMTRIDSNRFAFTSYYAGLYLLDLDKQMVQHWMHDPIDPRSIGGNNTLNVRYDSSGYLFITTQTSGVHFFNLKQKQIASKSYFTDANNQIFDGYIQSITSENGTTLWIGAQDRLIKWDSKTKKAVFPTVHLPDGSNISGTETIRAVLIDEKGQLWVGTNRFGLLLLDKKLRTVKQVTDSIAGKKSKLPARQVNTIATDQNGNFWVGTVRGTCIIDKNNYEVISITDNTSLGEMAKASCSSLWKDKKNRMWAATFRGAWCYDAEKKTVKNYSTKEGLPHNNVLAISEDDYGNTYFATLGGLAILSKNGVITNFNRLNGLRNDRCEELLKDEKGFMWIGNLNCIIRYDPVNKKFAIYEEGIGFSHAGYRVRCATRNNTGEMFWGTDKGIVYFLPEQMNRTAIALHPQVNTLQAGSDIFRFTSADELRFPSTTSSFVFYFASGELSGDKKNQLMYKLNGFDKDWQQPISTGQAVYSKLPPGKYTFELKASTDGINWVQAAYPIILSISKPWWKQNWFRLAMITLILTGIYFVYVHYMQRRRTKEIKTTIEYFANSPYEHSSADDILWDICRNCISRLGFEDCVIYVPDNERKVLVQKAAFGPKNAGQNEIANPIEIPFGCGIVGDVAFTGKSSLIHDTSKDSRYIVDDKRRFSELTVPIIYEEKVIAVIDSEHHQKNFYTKQDLVALQNIASLCAAKISRSMALEAMRKSREELLLLNVKMAETKFLNLRLQMNPHFLFNSLSSIQHLIVSQQTNKAYKYLTVFSNFLRSLLNFADKNFIPLDEELKILKMYVELESLRFDESFTWEINTDENLDHDEVFVPSLMVQPFVENAIWHGLLHKEGEKKLSIHFTSHGEEYLSCIIEDNGIGRSAAAIIKEKNINSKIRESKGVGIIEERLRLLEQKTGKPASLSFEDLYDNLLAPAGTRVQIIIPYYNPEEI